MAKVISTDPSPKVEKQTICNRGCGATVAYVPNDVKEYNGQDYSGGPDGQRWIDCPNCGKKIILESW